jgi:hypothetical protein
MHAQGESSCAKGLVHHRHPSRAQPRLTALLLLLMLMLLQRLLVEEREIQRRQGAPATTSVRAMVAQARWGPLPQRREEGKE